MNVVACPIFESNTELQGTRHSSMTARDVGGTTDRNSLRARQAPLLYYLREREREFRLLKGIAEGTYNTKHAEAARLYYTTILRYYYIHTQTPTEL